MIKNTIFKRSIDFNIKLFTKIIMVTLVFEINNSNIYIIIILINQNIMMLPQIIILESKIYYLKIIIFLLIYYLIDIVIKDKYF